MEQPSHCLNCGAPLYGPYCYACGQPVKGMVRHLRSILHDFLDTVFEYDSRIWRSLVPLYFRPGRITLEFLAGKRMRFVLPFRLFFVLTVLSFLVLQVVLDASPDDGQSAGRSIRQADTVAEVQEVRRRALADLAEARRELEEARVAAGVTELADLEEVIDRAAEERIAWLEAARAARAEGRSPPPEPGGISFGGETWDPETNPLQVDWLPAAANDQLNAWIGRAQRNLERAGEEPEFLLDSFLGLLPAALFVLMPLFALMLKVFYVGKRWFYMSHLVVALHSHSFLVIAMMVTVLLDSLANGVAGTWAEPPARFATAVSQAWIPVYLLLMQKRVYAQHWAVTLLKFVVIGSLYTVVLTFTAAAVAVISLVVA